MAQPGCSQNRPDGEVRASLKYELQIGWQTGALFPAVSGQEPSASPLSPLSDAMCLFIPHAAAIPGMSHHVIHSNEELDLLTWGETGGFRVQIVLLSLGHPSLNSVFRAGARFYILGCMIMSLTLDLNEDIFL